MGIWKTMWQEIMLRTLKWPSAITRMTVYFTYHQADSPLCLRPDVFSVDFQVYKNYRHTWHRISLLRPGVIIQHKTIHAFPLLQDNTEDCRSFLLTIGEKFLNSPVNKCRETNFWNLHAESSPVSILPRVIPNCKIVDSGKVFSCMPKSTDWLHITY